MAPVATAGRVCKIREYGPIRHIIDIDTITKNVIWVKIEAGSQHACNYAQRDIDDVVTKPPPIWITGCVASQQAQSVSRSRRGRRDTGIQS